MIENNLHIHFPDLLNTDFEKLDWQPFHGGITIFPLYKSSDTEASAALLKYVPGASAPEHIHQGYEHILVLEGSQEDATAVYEKGAFVINKPHTQHWVRSKNGCVVLAIWEKPVKFI